MKKIFVISAFLFNAVFLMAGTNIQIYYDFGSLNTACYNQRSNRVTTTVELFYPDNWGSTYGFIDLDYAIHPIPGLWRDSTMSEFLETDESEGFECANRV